MLTNQRKAAMPSLSPYVLQGVLPELSMKDVQSFFLSYLENEYSPRSAASRLLHGVTPFSVMPFSIRPAYEGRWIEIGRAMLPTGERMGPVGIQGDVDTRRFKTILADLKFPVNAVLQFGIVVQDFGIERRFSRVWTKLDRAAKWGALADRLLNDQIILQGLFLPKSEGFLMASHPAEVARINIQAVAKSKFLSIKDNDNFQVNTQTRLRQHIPLRSMVARHLIDVSSSLAFELSKVEGPLSWEHRRHELIDLEDIQDVAAGEALVRHVRWDSQCNDCHSRHKWDISLVIAPHDDLANDEALPPTYSANAK